MALSDTLSKLDEQKQAADKFEAEKPEIIQQHKVLIEGVLSDITRFVQQHIDKGQLSVIRSRASYEDGFLRERIETEKVTIKAGHKSVDVEPSGANLMGEIIFDVHATGYGSETFAIFLHPIKETVVISEQRNGQNNLDTRKDFNKENFEALLDQILAK